MFQVTFRATYGDPGRTIKKKILDYGSVDSAMGKLEKDSEQLTREIGEIIKRENVLTQSLANSKDTKTAERIKQMIKNMEDLISIKRNKVEEIKTAIANLWYGYHERL